MILHRSLREGLAEVVLTSSRCLYMIWYAGLLEILLESSSRGPRCKILKILCVAACMKVLWLLIGSSCMKILRAPLHRSI